MTVVVLRWPTEARERERCRALGVPRLLVLDGREPPPATPDALEDWVRPPLNPDDLRRRTSALQEQALAGVPFVDTADILRFGGRWLALPAADARLMRALVEAFGSLVDRNRLIDIVWPDRKPRRNAMDLRVLRLRRRIAPLQLAIETVRQRGYLLEVVRSRPKAAPPAARPQLAHPAPGARVHRASQRMG